MRGYFLLLLLLSCGGLRADDLSAFERKAEMNPSDPAAQFNWAVKAMQAKNYKAALKAAGRVTELEPKNAVAQELKGQILAETGDTDAALKSLNESVKLDPRRAGAWSLMARLYGAKDDKESLKKAAAAFENASKANPKNAKLVLNQGVILSKLGDDKKALLLFEKASKMEGGAAPAARYLCQLYNVQNANAKAEAACSLAVQDPAASAETWYYLGFAQSRLGKKSEAEKSFEKSVELNASFAPALYSLGYVDYEAGRLDSALKRFESAVEARKGNYPEAQFNVAVVLGDLGRWTQAAGIYRKILKKDSKNEDAQANLAFVVESGSEFFLNEGKDSYEGGDFDAASKAWKNALELDPDNAPAKEFLAKVKKSSAKSESASAARKQARQAVASKLKSEDEKVLKEGLAAAKNRQWAQAVKLLDFYSRKHPKDASARTALYKAKSELLQSKPSAPKAAVSAAALKKQYFDGVDSYLEGDLPKAIGIWKKILAADPGHLDARRSLSQAEVELAALQKKK
jgi:tetratricopeptide (TPR) repeat protein